MIEEKQNPENLKHEGHDSAETDDLKVVWYGSPPTVTQELLVGELQTPIRNVVHDASARDLEVLGGAAAGKNSFSGQLDQVRDRLPEALNSSKMKKNKLEKAPLENWVPI